MADSSRVERSAPHVSPRPPGPRPEPPPCLAVVGVLTPDPDCARVVVEELAAGYGGVALWGEAAPFCQTRYYEPEMGSALQRFYCALGELLPAEELPRLKRDAWAVERRHLEGGRRPVNLDPGVLDHSKVVLASFKQGPQKIHLGGGIWADLVLYYQNGGYGPLPWTFPDLKGGDHRAFFAAARKLYKERLKAQLQAKS